jgi:hypothetical protein
MTTIELAEKLYEIWRAWRRRAGCQVDEDFDDLSDFDKAGWMAVAQYVENNAL